MTNLLHSSGQTYTEFADLDGKTALARGILKKADGEPLLPGELPDFLASEKKLVLRQTISVLDKIVQKRNTLRGMSLEAYVHRARLAHALWIALKVAYKEFGIALPADERATLEDIWQSKAHPYYRFDPDGQKPESDGNGQKLREWQSDLDREEQPFEAYQGKWFDVFWQPADGKPDYRAMAAAVISHLFVQEVTLNENGKPRLIKRKQNADEGQPTAKGLMRARGHTAAKSANDPRNEAKKLRRTWKDAAVTYYFQQDVVSTIYEELTKDGNRMQEYPTTRWFGSKLYQHFYDIGGAPEGELRAEVWNLHNAVRGYYKKLAQSQKFRRAWREGDTPKLKAILPSNKAVMAGGHNPDKGVNAQVKGLLARRHGDYSNAYTSRMIRLGKLMIHAADAAFDANAGPQETALAVDSDAFKAKMDALATSEGQSEIKLKETNARTWRKASALALRTTKALVDMDGTLHEEGEEWNKDIAGSEVAEAAFKQFRASSNETDSPLHSHINRQLGVIFGAQEFEFEGTARNRASLFIAENVNDQAECLWALMRLAGKMRDQVFHFNVRRRLLDEMGTGLLTVEETAPTGEPPEAKKIRAVAQNALDDLLAFDRKLERQAVKKVLMQIDAAKYVELGALKEVVAQMALEAEIKQFSFPRCQSVLQMASNVLEADGGSEREDLAIYRTIIVGNKAGADAPDNKCRVGLLRELYNSGFRDWYQKKADDKAIFKDCIQKYISEKNDRAHRFKGRKRATKSTIAETVEQLDPDKYGTFRELLEALAADAMHQSGEDRAYNPNAKVQKDNTQLIEGFKQEIFAQLFAKYLEDEELAWIAGIKETVDPEADTLDKAMATYPDANTAATAWEAQFYAWLYLVPPEEISLLRHQMLKSIALEKKHEADVAARPDVETMQGGMPQDTTTAEESATDNSDRTGGARATDHYAKMDRLMGLYTKVQSVGFRGDEHEGALSDVHVGFEITSPTTLGQAQHLSLYETQGNFKALYTDPGQSAEDGDAADKFNLAGTRKGLRQMVRYAHVDVVKELFDKHRISDEEVRFLMDITSEKNKERTDKYHRLRKEIQKLEDDIRKERDEDTKNGLIKGQREKINDYKETALECRAHDFKVNAARLTDHVKLHRMIIQIVGRLTDYTAQWERDRLYAFLGMLYTKAEGKGFSFNKGEGERDKIKLRIDDATVQGTCTQKTFDIFTINKGFATEQFKSDANPKRIVELLVAPGAGAGRDTTAKDWFVKTFVQLDQQEEHPGDIARGELAKRDKKSFKRFPHGGHGNSRLSRFTIRNDVAHQNILEKDRPDLTYVINAVRSLMAYDRKSKNVLPKSIKRILGDYGLCIDWQMGVSDRLTQPVIYPARETHLGFCRHDEHDPIPFDLPRASPRLASMAMGMFTPSRSGNTIDDGIERKIGYATNGLAPSKLFDNEVLDAVKVEFKFRKSVKYCKKGEKLKVERSMKSKHERNLRNR